MKIGIIGAMDEEINYLREKMDQLKEYQIANSLFLEGRIAGKEIILLKSGIGKVNAAMTTTIMMERFQPSIVINTGSAGGFSDRLSVGDIVIGEEVLHHDVDATAFNYEYGQVPQMPKSYRADRELVQLVKQIIDELADPSLNYELGLIATGDSFMNDAARVALTKQRFPNMLAAEMEGAAIAQVCYQYDVPFLLIRSLSDIAGKDSSISFEQFLKLAAQQATKLILSLINRL